MTKTHLSLKKFREFRSYLPVAMDKDHIFRLATGQMIYYKGYPLAFGQVSLTAKQSYLSGHLLLV